MQQAVQYKMKLPADVHRWLKENAAKSLRSMNSEIVFSIRQRMGEEAAGEGPEKAYPAADRNDARQGVATTHG